jgi:predicted N-formylglutamate amidohydrolase
MPKENLAKAANSNTQRLVITCEHGGNTIPSVYKAIFPDQELLNSHRGFDLGALSMATDLAAAFAAPLVSATISRLLVDLNRSIGNPTLHAQVIYALSAEERQQILQHYYQPYRAEAEQTIRRVIAEQGSVIHLSSHSFTPVLDGIERRADIGLLYDPSRAGEMQLCKNWQAELKASHPEFIVRRNYPYAGKGDGLTAYLRRQLPPAVYVGIELEINHKYIFNAAEHWTTLRKVMIDSLARVLVSQVAPTS